MESLEAVMRDYVAAISGVVETNQERAHQLALRLADAGAAGGERVGDLADDIATTADSTHRRLLALVRTEAEAAVARVQAGRDAELARLSARLGELEEQIAVLRSRLSAGDGPAGTADAGQAGEADLAGEGDFGQSPPDVEPDTVAGQFPPAAPAEPGPGSVTGGADIGRETP